jgi:hypothetical protein
LLNDQWLIEKITEEIKSFPEFNENVNTTYQNPWETAKIVLRGKFIAMSAHIKRTERFQVKDLMLRHKCLKKQKQAKPKTNRRKIIKIWTKINEIITKKKYKESTKQKASSLKK